MAWGLVRSVSPLDGNASRDPPPGPKQQCILDLEQQHQQQQQELVETRSKVAILQKVAKLLCTSVNVLNQDLETELGLQATIASAAEEQRSANAMELEEQAERLRQFNEVKDACDYLRGLRSRSDYLYLRSGVRSETV